MIIEQPLAEHHIDDAVDARHADGLSDQILRFRVFDVATGHQADERMLPCMPGGTGDQHEIKTAVSGLQHDRDGRHADLDAAGDDCGWNIADDGNLDQCRIDIVLSEDALLLGDIGGEKIRCRRISNGNLGRLRDCHRRPAEDQ